MRMSVLRPLIDIGNRKLVPWIVAARRQGFRWMGLEVLLGLSGILFSRSLAHHYRCRIPWPACEPL